MTTRQRPVFAAALAILLALAACGRGKFPEAIPGHTGILIRLERGACFGTCPIYHVEIDEDGDVTYNGEMFVAVTGAQTALITLDDVQTLLDAFEAIDFYNLSDQIEQDVTDLPTVTITLIIGAQEHTVIHYLGDFDAPDALTDLEDLIDEIANTRQWIEGE